jgi:hypothetical protein
MARSSTPLLLVARPTQKPSGCKAAVRFAAWVEEQLSALTGEGQPSPVAVHRAVVRLTWQFFYERKGADPEHRDRVHEENGAPCLYGVFLDALEQLHELHMAAEKLELIEKAPVPTAPAAPQPRPRSVAEAMAAALQDVV